MSSYISVREFLPMLEATVPAADSAMLQLQTVLTAIDFCKKTHFHQEQLDIDLVADQAHYRLTVPAMVQLAGVRKVVSGITGLPLDPKSPETLDRTMPGWRNYTASEPVYWYQAEQSSLCLVPVPTEDRTRGVVVHVALSPSPKAKQIYQRLYDDFYNEILAGTISRLCSMPKRDWSDRVTAAEQRLIYEKGIRYAKGMVEKNFSNESIFVEPQTFG